MSCFVAQVWRLRRRVPRRVPSESSAVSSLRPPRAPPQEAVLLLVTWWRQPRLLLPALPRHLRSTEGKKKSTETDTSAAIQVLKKKMPDKVPVSRICVRLWDNVCDGGRARNVQSSCPTVTSRETKKTKQNKSCIRLYGLQLHVSVLLSNVAHVLRLSSLYHTFPFTYCISYSRGKNVCEITAGASMLHAWAWGGQSSRFSFKKCINN